MFLSEAAMQLLSQRNFQALRWLPLEQLLAGDALERLESGEIPFRSQAASAQASGPSFAVDPIMHYTMKHPVALSSGHILSKENAETLLASDSPVCPFTKRQLDKTVMYALPQLSLAIARWKFMQAISTYRLSETTGKLIVQVSNDKIRMEVKSQLYTAVTDFLHYYFNGRENNITNYSTPAYRVEPWSFCWRSRYAESRLEMWFPKGGARDDEMSLFIGDIISAVEDNQAEGDAPPSRSMSELPDREYLTVYEGVINKDQLSHLLVAFIRNASQLRESKHESGHVFIDKAIGVYREARRSINLGAGVIGGAHMFAPGLAASGASSSGIMSQRTSQSTQTQSTFNTFSFRQ